MTAIISASTYALAVPRVYPSVDIPRQGAHMAGSRHVVPLVRAVGPSSGS